MLHKFFLLLLLLVSLSVMADVYQTQKPDGSLVFTDQASTDSQPVQFDTSNIYQPVPPAKQEPEVSSKNTPAVNKQQNNSTSNNPQPVTVTITSPSFTSSAKDPGAPNGIAATWLLNANATGNDNTATYPVAVMLSRNLAADETAILLINSVGYASISGPTASMINFAVNVTDLQTSSAYSYGETTLRVQVLQNNTQTILAQSQVVTVNVASPAGPQGPLATRLPAPTASNQAVAALKDENSWASVMAPQQQLIGPGK